MSLGFIEVNTTWRVVGTGGGGSTATGSGTAFNIDTRVIEQWSTTRNLAVSDPAPADVHLAVGALLYVYCDEGTTATKYFYDGGTATRTETEANSAYCGYVPPAACDLGTASVQQQVASAGATLTVSFTGTAHGTMHYALDGGAEQSSAVFRLVAGGAHTVSLRDDGVADCTRTVNVTVVLPAPPPTIPTGPPTGPAQGVDFVQQPLWYAVADAVAGGRVELELFAESSHGAEDFASVLVLRKVADAQGHAAFRLDTLLLPLLRAFVPAAATTTRRCTTNLLNYYVRTAVYDAAGAPTFQVGPLRTALRGGLPAEWQGTDYFALRAGDAFAHSPALSWQPTGPGTYAASQVKAITRQQPEWLFWLCPTAATGLRVARAYDMGAGTVPVVDYEALPAAPARGWRHQLLAIPLAPARPGFLRLMVQVETLAGEALSLPAWYAFTGETPRSRYLLFTNSLGAVDTLRCEGRLEATLEAVTEKVELPAVAGTGAPAADRQLADLAASRKLKLTTGWLTAAELAWMQELVLSRELWLSVAGQLRPLDWPKRSLAVYSDEPGLRKLQLEFDYAYAPTAYAPGTY